MSTDITIYETVNNVTVYEDVTSINISDDVIDVLIDQSNEETTVTISNDQGLPGLVQSISPGDISMIIGGTDADPTVRVNSAVIANTTDYQTLNHKTLNGGDATLTNNTIQVKSDGLSVWAINNPVLAAGEIGLEFTTGQFKIGDGVTAWNSLSYATDSSKITGTINDSKLTSGVTTTGEANKIVKTTATGGVNASGNVGAANVVATVAVSAPTLAASTQLQLSGSTSGTMVLKAPAVAGTSTIQTLPTATGTLYNTANKNFDEYRAAGTYDILARSSVDSTRTLVNGTIHATIFTPQSDFTFSNLTSICTTGGTDTGGTIVRRMGLFTVSGNTLTLVARTASDATLWNTSNTVYTRALNTTGGYPSTYTLAAGTTYAIGVIAYNTGGTYAAPVLVCGNTTTQLLQPYMTLGLTLQTDLPTAATAFGTITNSMPFARLS